MVLLSTKTLGSQVLMLGNSDPRICPFEVDSMVGNVAVKLSLPREWSRIHVFSLEAGQK